MKDQNVQITKNEKEFLVRCIIMSAIEGFYYFDRYPNFVSISDFAEELLKKLNAIKEQLDQYINC